jgi:preprotein translocase SecF subunit
MRRLRLVPDDTKIQFMRGRHAGLIVSARLSIASVIMFFTPGLNYGIDFLGGVVVELRLPGPADNAALRDALESLRFGEVKLQQFGSPRDILIKLDVRAGSEDGRRAVQNALSQHFPGSELRRVEVVGSKVSKELFEDGLLATVLALAAILIYIWFRFEWQFGVGVVATLVLDATKTIGFFALTRLQFDLNSLAAIMILIGYSVTDKVVVYDRIRENLRKHKTMPLRALIDLSHQSDAQPYGGDIADRAAVDPAACFHGWRVRAGLRRRHHLRHRRRHVILDLHRLADSLVPRRKAPAAGRGERDRAAACRDDIGAERA